MPNYVIASGSNCILDQLTHLRAQGIYRSGGVPASAMEQSYSCFETTPSIQVSIMGNEIQHFVTFTIYFCSVVSYIECCVMLEKGYLSCCICLMQQTHILGQLYKYTSFHIPATNICKKWPRSCRFLLYIWAHQCYVVHTHVFKIYELCKT